MDAGVEVEAIGRTGGTRLIFELPEGDHAVALADLRAAHEGFFPALMGDSLAG
jgi:phosphoribosylformylglycinamidine synthase